MEAHYTGNQWTYLEVKKVKSQDHHSRPINVCQIEAVWRAIETVQSSKREVPKYKSRNEVAIKVRTDKMQIMFSVC